VRRGAGGTGESAARTTRAAGFVLPPGVLPAYRADSTDLMGYGEPERRGHDQHDDDCVTTITGRAIAAALAAHLKVVAREAS
jgi:hypothetical protein